MLYEATVGERPFQGGDALSTLYQLLEEPIVPPSARLAGYPPELEKIVLKAMERDRDARYQTSEELSRALDGWLMTEKAMVSDGSVAAVLKTALGERLSKRQKKIDAAIHAIDTGARAPQDSLNEPISTSESGSLMPQPPRLSRRCAARSVAGKAFLQGVDWRRCRRCLARARLFPHSQSCHASRRSVCGRDHHHAHPQRTAGADRCRATAYYAGRGVDPVASAAPTPSTEASATASPRIVTPRLRPTATPKPSVTTATTTTPTSTAPRSGDLPPVIRRPPRTLDSDNPFDPKPE